VPYFSSGTTWATSAALAANALVVGGGAGAAPASVTTGTGVVTALGVNTGSAGAFVVNGGALGTPSSGTVTNLTGTASININGTVGATTANTGAFTTLSASSTVSGTGFSTYLASPPAIGGTAAAAGSFTTLAASSTVSGTGFSTYLASPPAIGGTVPAAGTFTTAKAIAAATQDSVQLQGRAGGTSSYVATITPTTLTANRTLTLPDASGTLLVSGPILESYQTISSNYSVTSGSNAFSVGPVTVATGVAVTVPTGQVWLIAA
jgi:hypothetical protein